MRIASIYLLDAPFHIDREYDYILPDTLCAVRGDIALVPFGRSNRCAFGFVSDVREGDADGLKEIYDIADSRFSLGEELFELALFLKKTTLCTFGEAARTMMPPAIFSSPHKTESGYRFSAPDNIKTDKLISLANGDAPLRSDMHRCVVSFLRENGECEREHLCEATGATHAQLKTMMDKGVIRLSEVESYRNPYEKYAKNNKRDEIILSRAQLSAYEQICAQLDRGEPTASLLFGVTGSGKTKVMLRAIDEVMDRGRGVIMLVPEIALTPQTVSIFCSRYGERVAVIHSSLSSGERFDAWRRIRDGRVDLVIGTRSAVFAPIKNLGLIIVDEEHEHTYKSDSDPKYHVRDVCAMRCKQNVSHLILASATPSVESFYRAEKGIYKLIRLTERYGNARLPSVHTVDMREELMAGNTSPIGRLLYEKMNERKERGEQSILFLNRRGYHASLHCRKCGKEISCPQCSVAMTYHIGSGAGHMCCHICGYKSPRPTECPECKSDDISSIGTGTQRVESELSILTPDERVLRMDADTTSSKAAYERMLDSFRNKEYDVLLGTQMVAKGHDFEDVSLVGVLLADTSLYVNDFRAAERTFSVLTQVIGRAGRGRLAGEAVIQTFRPDSEVIKLAARQDYEGFYRAEIEKRRSFLFPPFCDIAAFTLSISNEKALKDKAKDVSEYLLSLAQKSTDPLVIYGPVEPPIYKMAGKYRAKFIIKTALNSRVRALLSDVLTKFSGQKDMTLTLDINPTNT